MMPIKSGKDIIVYIKVYYSPIYLMNIEAKHLLNKWLDIHFGGK